MFFTKISLYCPNINKLCSYPNSYSGNTHLGVNLNLELNLISKENESFFSTILDKTTEDCLYVIHRRLDQNYPDCVRESVCQARERQLLL